MQRLTVAGRLLITALVLGGIYFAFTMFGGKDALKKLAPEAKTEVATTTSESTSESTASSSGSSSSSSSESSSASDGGGQTPRFT